MPFFIPGEVVHLLDWTPAELLVAFTVIHSRLELFSLKSLGKSEHPKEDKEGKDLVLFHINPGILPIPWKAAFFHKS